MNDKRRPHLPRGIYAFIGDSMRARGSLLEQMGILLRAGIGCIQLRLKGEGLEAPILERVVEVVEHSKALGALCIINDRIDMALLSGAAGVHLGEEDMPVVVARRLLGGCALIGKTVRNLEQVEVAKGEGADYVGLGPIFETRTKFLPIGALGVEVLSEVVKRSPLPVVAIGGISVLNIAEVAATGVHAAAVISDIWQALEPGQRVLELRDLFTKAESA